MVDKSSRVDCLLVHTQIGFDRIVTRLGRITDISSRKPDCLSGSKFSLSGSLILDESVICRTASQNQANPPDGLEAMRREAEECAPAACRMRPKGGDRGRKIWTASKDVWKPCNPLKSPKTAKALFGKAWSKTREFWRSLEKSLGGAVIPPRLLPPTVGLRSSWTVIVRS